MEGSEQNPVNGENKLNVRRTKSSATIHPAEWTDITNVEDPEGDRMFNKAITPQDLAPEAGLPTETPPEEASPFEDYSRTKTDRDVLEDN